VAHPLTRGSSLAFGDKGARRNVRERNRERQTPHLAERPGIEPMEGVLGFGCGRPNPTATVEALDSAEKPHRPTEVWASVAANARAEVSR